jgi:TPR repeat protein
VQYLEVYVTITPGDSGKFDVKAASKAGGEGNSSLKLPFAVTDLAGVMFSRGAATRNFDAVDPPRSGPAGTAVSFGEQLFEALFQGETLEVLSRTESAAKAMADTGVRIRLSMNLAAEGMAEVASLPWELMRRRNQQALVVSVQTPVVRAFDTPKPIMLQPVSGKLRILAVISNPTGTAALNLADEKARISKIWATLDNIEVDFVRPVEEDLLNHLAANQYHVVHYMGHGDFDSGAGGLLMLEHENGSARPVSGENFAAWLADEPLRLVFLNACNTGTTGEHMGLHPFAGVASALIRSGVPAVVAMQFPISDAAAIIFAQTFYQRIAQGFPVDAAASDGRKRLLTSDGAEWATPVLYMRASDGHLFDQTKAAVTPRKRVAAKPLTDAMPAMAPVMASEPPPVLPPTAGTPWFRRPLVLGGAALAAVLVAIAASQLGGPTSPDAGTAAVTDAEAPMTAEAALAEISDDLWINDPGETTIASTILAKVPLDHVRALADAGDAKAAYVAGLALWFALKNTPESKASAAGYFATAAAEGLAVAEYSMGWVYIDGVAAETASDGSIIPGVESNRDEAHTLLAKAVDKGNVLAWDTLVDTFHDIRVIPDRTTPDPDNPATAAIAAINPQRWYDDQDAYVDPPASVAKSVLASASIDQIRELAEAGNAKANYVMGRIYNEGLAGQSQDFRQAEPWMRVAARGGIAEAMFFLGWTTAEGLEASGDLPEMPKNPELSKAWFTKAAELGNPLAASSMGS